LTNENNKKIVALNGSPHHNGNTVLLMKWVIKGCQMKGAKTEWIHLTNHTLNFCKGCFSCLRTGKCILKDDLEFILDILLNADGIIVGAPVYEDAPPALFKNLMDRLALLNLYTDLFENQFSVGVSTSGIAPYKKVAKEISIFFGRRIGSIGSKTASLKLGYCPLKEVYRSNLPKKAKELGKI